MLIFSHYGYLQFSASGSLIWICDFLGNVWIFTREQHPLNETLRKAFSALKKNNLPTKFLIKSDQSNCIRPEIEYEIETDPDAEYIDDIDLKKNPVDVWKLMLVQVFVEWKYKLCIVFKKCYFDVTEIYLHYQAYNERLVPFENIRQVLIHNQSLRYF